METGNISKMECKMLQIMAYYRGNAACVMSLLSRSIPRWRGQGVDNASFLV